MVASNNCLRSLRVPRHVDARRTPRVLPRSTLLAYYSGRNLPARLVAPREPAPAKAWGHVALSRIAPGRKCTPQGGIEVNPLGCNAADARFRLRPTGLTNDPGSALSLLNRPQACLLLVILGSFVSQRP